MRESDGFIFIMTLIITSVVSLLVLTCMQHILLYQGVMKSLELQHQNFYQMEALAQQLLSVKHVQVNKACVVPEDNPNDLMHKLMRSDGCSLELYSEHYHYFIEDWDGTDCLVINIKGVQYSVHHRRVSLIHTTKNGLPRSFIQLRGISAIKLLPCQGIVHEVLVGVSSWRYVAEL
jgi:hypothetical protein